MPIQPPNLDDRTFKALVDEAKARIPTYTPEWTNFNDSDPGMTLVKLQAWLTETLLYRVNRLPELAYINFLNMIGTTPSPARAASADLTFRFADLDRVGDPLTILVPKGTQVAVKDPSLPKPLIFETDETLRGVNAAVAALVVPSDNGLGRQVVGSYDPDAASLTLARPFLPFGDGASLPEMLVGLLLRPIRDDAEDYFLDRFPEGELNLTLVMPDVFDQTATGSVNLGPNALDCLFPWQASDRSADISWAVYAHAGSTVDLTDDAHWLPLNLRGDGTAGVSRSGHVYLDLPANLPVVSWAALDRTFWAGVGLQKPPSSKAELVADLNTGVFLAADLPLDIWKGPMGLVNPPLQDLGALTAAIQAAPEPDFAAIDPAAWTDLGYDAAPAPHGLLWLRARQEVVRDRPPEIAAVMLNTVRATAATSRVSEVLGTSAGRPNQTFQLSRTPVLIDPTSGQPVLELAVVPPNGGDGVVWQLGNDFHGAHPDTQRFLLDPETGVVTFGDGVNGMVPVAGSRILANSYRVGGGALGNVAAGTITALKTALPQVESVSNQRAATGGSDAETLDQAKLRAPSGLRSRDRAVTAEDFADLARTTPGVALKSAYALPQTAVDFTTPEPVFIENAPGAVTVVVLPDNRHPTPQPTEEELRLICAHLNARRLVTTELYVIGPRYIRMDLLQVEIEARQDADLKSVQDVCHAALLAYFHPLSGGEDGAGWPFGGSVYHGNVFNLLLRQPGVLRVVDLKIALENLAQDDTSDVLPLAPGSLIELPPSVIALNVRYGRG
ncbi:MAG: putative baseplate assembly protein [Tabrizicola sp.]|jgi:hypothetical protein|nr:putative baseplate assembly protein [Tabrizicola sp.]